MSGLQMGKVGDLCEQIRGVTYSKNDAVLAPRRGFKPVLRANNITDRGLSFDELVFVPESNVNARQYIKKNDIVIAASSGSIDVVGKAARALVDFDGGFGAFCKVLRPSKAVDPSYFSHYFQTKSYRQRISQLAAGANINNLRNEHLNELEILLPPLAEQRRIAAILDKADTLRAKRREAIAKLDQLLQSVFLELFGDPVGNPKGWPRVPFSDLLDRIESGTSPVCLDRPAVGDEWAVLKLGAVTRCEFDPSANKALPSDVLPDESLEVRVGDLLFSRKNTRDLVAACALVASTPPRLLMPDLVFRLRLKEGAAVSPYFLQALLTYPSKRKEIQNLAGGSSGSMPNISKAKLLASHIELPPIDLQLKYQKFKQSTLGLREKNTKSLISLNDALQSLQQRAFAGTL